ncbi:MAG: arsenate reductase ArsC [Methanobacterium sp.]|nr:arsenate reductase ArsC [Methanobacterium sp.]
MTTQKVRERVLFLCNHNSARSQMAEGLLISLYGEHYEAYSAGSNQACPFFPGGKTYLHESFEDPVAVDGTDHEKTDACRRIRDEIKEWIKETF